MYILIIGLAMIIFSFWYLNNAIKCLKKWQIGEEQEVYIKYNSENPNIFEEVNELRETYGNPNKYAVIFMFGAFIMFFIGGVACMISYNL